MELKSLDFHRNGIYGNGFYVVLFRWKDGRDQLRNMVGIVFDEPGSCAVFDTLELVKDNIDFASGNSWRGDHFEGRLREWIREYNAEHF